MTRGIERPGPPGAGAGRGERGGGSRKLTVGVLTRVEGEGALDLRVRHGKVVQAELRIYEPPRFFEALLRGRHFAETPDIVARICGICPVAYQMSAVHALERAFGVAVDGPLRALRRLIYCGEWIESHGLHVVLLHAPDFLGYESGIHMARDHGEQVTRGLQIKKAGNEIVSTLGGREIHPVNVRVGGFYRVPRKRELRPLRDRVARARDEALELLRWVRGFPMPDFERDYVFVALRHPAEYPMNEGAIASSVGHELDARDYERHFTEVHVERSTALHSRLEGHGPYLTGPLARYALNHERLSPLAAEAARASGLGPVCRNPFRSILVRMVELVQAADDAVRILDGYEEPDAPFVPVGPETAGVGGASPAPLPSPPAAPSLDGTWTGWAGTEAPRGLLYHRYRVGTDGLLRDARIVPPTSQNQAQIESDLREYAGRNLHLDDAGLSWACEHSVRNYDPCISCSTHFLTVRVHRE